jgi:hypothetical protein
VKDIFKRKTFWGILVILLLAVFIYPPWLEKVFIEGQPPRVLRYWGLIFTDRPLNPNIMMSMELDLKMILAESIIAILLAIGICLIPFHKGKKNLKIDRKG